MATFGGAFIFGAAVKMNTVDDDRSTQVNAFFGLSGMEALDGGLRGRNTTVTGLIYGASPTQCQTRVELFRSYNDGQYYTLIDTSGFFWLNVRLRMFQPQERAFAHTQLGYTRAYSATFHHLV